MENLVAIELRRRYGDGQVWYYNDTIEIDFLIPEQQTAIQVTWDLHNEDTRKRELTALEKFHKSHPDYRLQLITRYHEPTSLSLTDGTPVETLGIVKWLLT